MGRFSDRFRLDDPVYRLETNADGLTLVRRAGQSDAFNTLARQLINGAGSEFVVLPISDGQTGYERVVLLSLTD
jgi:hypothetical protein